MGGAGSVRLAAALLAVALTAAGSSTTCAAQQLRRNYYAGVCPNVESIVRGVMAKKVQQTATTIGATVRLFFHDCFVQGCDASVIVASAGNNTAEKDHPNNLSLAGDGFDAVIRAKAAVDAVPRCRNKVSCADILAMGHGHQRRHRPGRRPVVRVGARPARRAELHQEQRRRQAAGAIFQPGPAQQGLRR
ncbi:unnamed protein product [Urochloa humidicola]